MSKKFSIDSLEPIIIKRDKKLFKNNSVEFFSDAERLSMALSHALLDGDEKAFFEIIKTYLSFVNKEELSRRSKVPIATIRRMAAGQNFNVDNLLKITSTMRVA